MKCPNCRDSELEYITTMYLDYKDSVQEIADPYYKCHKCKKEFDPEDLEEE